MIQNIPKDFILGAASSAWQTEGWQGKKEGQDSYLDSWYKEEYFVWHEGYGPDVATNFMEKYQEDIDHMQEIGLTHYRTSINWSRFFTDYESLTVDEDYAKHISDMIDALIKAGVEPMLCLEHYELPAYLLETYDGWSSKKVVELFTNYAEIAFERYADRVKNWFVFNEPVVVQTRVYLDAIRWPHEQDTKKWMQWNHHKVLATAKAVEVYRKGNYDGRIGTILNPEVTYARSSSEADQKAAHIFDLFFNRVFLDPAVKGVYPEELIELLKKHEILFDHDEEELAIIKRNTVDYLGINLYFPKRVQAPKHAWNSETPFHPEQYYDSFELPGRRMNKSRGWEIYPKLMFDMAMRIKEEYNNIPWLITENGMGIEQEERFMDDKGTVQDEYRIEFLGEHISWLLKAVEAGSSCEGYMLWAFTDCVSPMNAFKNRYGLVRIDIENDLNRSMKQSGYWYKEMIENRRLETKD
ncbi:glycoside hydrolase family 1 protein [Marinilactibacillus sp. XAAS-LB27]|uniref:glycoside hydrolase family 1 protein n=1 Tax=Marinilactibacillus sp. XAAS-LB27 TaxID=3114538 RepID=UPI002E19DEF1|nr:glycoside hydrolase family 1 protein [Marinilactibacillus sp. XAAS-LB27]